MVHVPEVRLQFFTGVDLNSMDGEQHRQALPAICYVLWLLGYASCNPSSNQEGEHFVLLHVSAELARKFRQHSNLEEFHSDWYLHGHQYADNCTRGGWPEMQFLGTMQVGDGFDMWHRIRFSMRLIWAYYIWTDCFWPLSAAERIAAAAPGA